MIKTFVCVHDFNLIKELLEQMNGSEGVVIAGVTTAIPQNTHIFHNVMINVVVIDCTRSLHDALALSKLIREDKLLDLRIIYLVDDIEPSVLNYLLSHQEDSSYVVAPFSADKIKHVIVKEGCVFKDKHLARKNKESFVFQELQNMGLPIHLKGFAYVKEASLLLYKDQTILQTPMKHVYKEIARTYETTISRVEKAIRTTVDYAFRETPHLITIRGVKPTNSQLIHLMCERMLLHDLEKKSEEIT